TKTVQDWSLRSPGARSDSVAYVQGFDGDGYDMGNLVVSGACCKLEDGHFSFGYPGTGGLTKEHGVRPALWLHT
ncbi:MAG: hypothetical protein LBI03_03510, partial [Clostridiales bacterium]|nr:hypothetical protein [Clostridiales bacterium]